MSVSSIQDLLTGLNPQQSQMLECVKAWSQINSGSLNLTGLAQMRNTLQQAFAPLNADTQILKAKPWWQMSKSGQMQQTVLGDVLQLRKRPNAKIQVLLVGHMDTVFGVDHPFQNVTENGDTLHGPGVADLKGGLVVMLHALQVLEASPWAGEIGWEVLINADEELGSRGSADYLLAAAKRHHVGLIFEPSPADGSIVGERKGIGNFTVAIKGRAAHAGRDHALGRSAILALSEFVMKAEALNGTMANVTLNVGKIEGGEAVNSVPAEAICQIDVRVSHAEDFATLEQKLAAIASEVGQKDGIALKIDGGLNRPPKLLTPKIQKLFSLYQDCAQTLGKPLKMTPSGGCCDGNNLAAAGLPNLDTLGVVGGAIHSDQEFLRVDSLVERAQLNALFLLRLAKGEIAF